MVVRCLRDESFGISGGPWSSYPGRLRSSSDFTVPRFSTTTGIP